MDDDDVARLLAIQEIARLKPRYWRCIDSKDWQALLDDVFDPEIEADFSGTGGGVYRGASGLVAVLEKALSDAVTAHHGGAPEIEIVNEHEARGVWSFSDRIERPSGTTRGMGVYHETYRRTDDGWRIASTRIERQFVEVERVGAEDEVRRLILTYASRLDAGDLAGVAELFVEGTITSSIDGASVDAVVGDEAVLARYRSATRLYDDGTPRTKHLTTNLQVDVDHVAGTASATSYYAVLQQTADLALQPIISGRYEDTFVHKDGRWLFDVRVIHVDLVGDLSHHLLFELP